jgi:hypothetical protein
LERPCFGIAVMNSLCRGSYRIIDVYTCNSAVEHHRPDLLLIWHIYVVAGPFFGIGWFCVGRVKCPIQI